MSNNSSNNNRNNEQEQSSGGNWLLAAGIGAAVGAGLAYMLKKSSQERCSDNSEPKVQNAYFSADDRNRTNQCNPTHKPTGPGHRAGYHGAGTKADLDNHSEQMNPNNPKYWANKNSTSCGTHSYEAAPRGCCSICRDEYDATITLRCGHILHRDCYEQMKLHTRGELLCPLCRKRAE